MMNTRDFDFRSLIPANVKPVEQVPFEQSDEYAALRERSLLSALKKAGLSGEQLKASCSLGDTLTGLARRPKGAYLYGLPGRGKTYAAAVAVREFVQSGKSAKIITVFSLLEAIKAGFSTGDDPLSRAENYELLVLDDFGAEKISEWSKSVLTGLIDTRANNLLPTILTSNYSLKEIRQKWGEVEGARIVSRIVGSCEIREIKGRDRRMA